MRGLRHIRVGTADGVLTVTIDRPEVMNALNRAAHRELERAFSHFEAEDALHVAVITGAGTQGFCVGSDLKERARTGHDDMPETGFAGLARRFSLNKPVVAAINGDAVGGGLEIVLACDLAIAVDHARFGLPEPRVGLAASDGLHRLARQVPTKWAMDIALTGRLFSAGEALQLGLVNRVVDSGGLPDALELLLGQLKACAPLSLRATKQLIRQGLANPSLEAAYADDYGEYRKMLASRDAVEGPRAFAEKRPPAWTGS